MRRFGNFNKNFYKTVNKNKEDDICIARYTYEAWKESRFPGEDISFNTFLADHAPDNYMWFLQQIYHEMKLYKIKNKDTRIRAIPYDETYLEWLASESLKDSEDGRIRYTQEVLQDIEARLTKEKLNVSTYFYAIPAVGIVDHDSVNLRLPDESVKKIRDYLDSIITIDQDKNDQDFKVWVSPYFVTADTIRDEGGRIINMANSWFDDGQTVRIDKFASIEFPGCSKEEMYATAFFLPVVVRENHRDYPVTIREVEESFGVFRQQSVAVRNIGRFLNRMDDLNFFGVFAQPVEESDAYASLKRFCSEIFGAEENCNVFTFMIPGAEALQFHNSLSIQFKRETRKEHLSCNISKI